MKTPEILDVSILCLMWVSVNPYVAEPELLLAGGSDKRVRVLKRNERENGMLGTLEMVGLLGAQLGVILALAQSSTHLATASGQCWFSKSENTRQNPGLLMLLFILFLFSDLDDCTIALWLLSELADVSTQKPLSLLNGHSGGVTCLAFSPDGGQLLSGGKDQVLSHN